MNRTVGAGIKGVAAFPRSAGIRRVEDEGEGAGVDGVAGRCTVAVRCHLGAESELDLRSTSSLSASPSLSLEHHQRRRRWRRRQSQKTKTRGVPGGKWRSWDMGSQRGRQGPEPLRTPGRGAASGICSA